MHSFIGFESAIWIPTQTSGDKVQKGFIVALQRLLKSLGTWSSSASLAAYCHPGFAHRIKK
jgi:hypothetical protein